MSALNDFIKPIADKAGEVAGNAIVDQGNEIYRQYKDNAQQAVEQALAPVASSSIESLAAPVRKAYRDGRITCKQGFWPDTRYGDSEEERDAYLQGWHYQDDLFRKEALAAQKSQRRSDFWKGLLSGLKWAAIIGGGLYLLGKGISHVNRQCYPPNRQMRPVYIPTIRKEGENNA